ncbi:MAG: chemotaxis protein CheW, partial [Bdellovibrionales bacterium]|nr:chemotaxis protein CheW [Bdellovibrionales bacterium]
RKKDKIKEVHIIDDGGGINLKKVEEIAIKKQIINEATLANMSENQKLALIFEPGFSTAEKLTDVSGRGVGTDMLKGSVEKIGGHINISTELTKGTHFSLFLPIPKSVLILNSLFVKVAGYDFAIARDEILRLLRLNIEDKKSPFQTLESTKLLEVDGELLPVVNLKEILKLKNDECEQNQQINAVVVQTKNMKYVMIVDEILDMEDAVVKQLDSSMTGVKGILGATFLGEGLLGLILNINQIGEMAGINESSFSVQPMKPIVQEPPQRVSNEFNYIEVVISKSESHYLIKANDVYRLESFSKQNIQWIGNIPSLIYENQVLGLYDLSEIMGFEKSSIFNELKNENFDTLIIKYANNFIGLVVDAISNLHQIEGQIHSNVTSIEQIKGNLIWNDKTYVLLDLEKLLIGINKQTKFIPLAQGIVV